MKVCLSVDLGKTLTIVIWKKIPYLRLLNLSLLPFLLIKSVADIAISLAEITDQIEHLYFNGCFIPACAFEVLFSSQKAIKTLHVKKGSFRTRLLTYFDLSELNSDVPRDISGGEIEEAVAKGVIQHEASLEDINIWIEIDEMVLGESPKAEKYSHDYSSPKPEEESHINSSLPAEEKSQSYSTSELEEESRCKTSFEQVGKSHINSSLQAEEEFQSYSTSELEEEARCKTSSWPEEESHTNSSLQQEDESQCNSTSGPENKSQLHMNAEPEEEHHCYSTILPTTSLFRDVVQLLGDRESYFPNLKSVSIMSTVPKSHSEFRYTDPDRPSEEMRYQKLFFERTFHENEIKRLDLFEGHTSAGYDSYNEFTSSLCDDALPLSTLIKAGKFSNLRVLNFLVFDLKDEDLIIKYCPHITHIYCTVGRYGYDTGDGLLKIIKHFGPQLLGLNFLIGEKTAKHIEQYCCNLESLGVLYENSFSCLSQMKKLKKLKIEIYQGSTVLENYLGSLIELEILNYDNEMDAKVFDVIRRGAKNLQYLRIEFGPGSFEDFVYQMERFIEFLEEFHCLEKLRVMLRSDYWYDYCGHEEEENNWKGHDKITALLLNNQSKLKRLHLSLKRFMSYENEMTLIEQMPRCKITFHDYDYHYG